jgi:hypothetical protein
LLQAAAQVSQRYGPSMSSWQLPVTCPVTTPPSCDQIVATAAGAINVPPQPFDNRGTFYQADAISGHRPEPAAVPSAPARRKQAAHHRRRRRHHTAPAFTG